MHPRIRAVVRAAVLTVNTPMAKGRTARAFARSERPLKLEIGGLDKRPGWVVTNVNAVTRNYMDATSDWPLEDASVSHIFSDNVIEHITLDQARRLFAEAYRCLQPGGVVRLVTPDMRKHIDLYLSGPSAVDSDVAKSYRDLGYDLVIEHPIDLVRIPIASFGHHLGYLWDFQALEAELKRAGFHSIAEVALGESAHGELHGLDLRTREGGAQIAVEAIK